MAMRFPLAICALAIAASGYAFDKIIVFGDSLSDMGNLSSGSLGLQPGSDYYQGRFSNGLVWVERWATRAGVPLARSTTTGGTNWAYGGASTGTGTFGFLFFQFPNVSTQVTRYLNTNPAITASQLYVIWAGANDYFDGQTNTAVPTLNIENMIRSLHTRGARQFLVPNLPLLGNVPRYRDTADAAAFNTRCAQHNAQLATRMATLRSSLAGISITEMNVASNLDLIQTYPAAWGLTNVTQPALVNGVVVPNPDQYLFYDDVHPTRMGHQALSNLAFDLTSPPNTVNGQISLGDWVGNTAALQATFRVFQGEAEVYTVPNVALSASGTYTFSIPRNGTYDVKVELGHWIRRKTQATFGGGPTTINILLNNGDSDRSGEVDAADIDAVIADFGGNGFNTDLDGSGETDAVDIDIVIANFGAVSD